MLESLFFLLGLTQIQEPATLLSPDLIDFSPVPQLVESRPAPVVGAKAAIVLDLNSGKVLFDKNMDERKPIASLTKMMTAVIARENFALDETVTVSENAASQPPAKINLKLNEQITVENLLYAILIRSGNDAAVALAEHFGGIEIFSEKMNAKAVKLNLKNTRFANSVGYDDPENYSTVYDLALLAGYVLNDPLLKEIVSTDRATIYSADGKTAHHLVSTNVLFNSYLDIRGLKTGSTEEAGECFAAIARAEDGRETLAIVLDSPNRFQEVKVLLEWANSSHHW